MSLQAVAVGVSSVLYYSSCVKQALDTCMWLRGGVVRLRWALSLRAETATVDEWQWVTPQGDAFAVACAPSKQTI